MSSATPGDGSSRKSFAQVAAAAHKPTVPQAKTPSQAEPDKNPQFPAVQPALPTSYRPCISRQNSARAQSADGQAQITNQVNDMMQAISLDDSHLQSSSLGNVGKRENSDTKSITSRTTLTLDEKESLRPDDSASMKAAAEEDTSSPSESVAAKSISDPNIRAFHDQLHEIDRTESSRMIVQRPSHPQGSHVPVQHNGGIVFGAQPGPPPVIHPDVMRIPPKPSGPPPDLHVTPDPKLLEALQSPKDRLYVLKVEQDLIDFMTTTSDQELILPQTNSFYRMLSHKLAEYHFLGHLVDDSLSSVRIIRLPHSRLSPPLISIEAKSQGPTPPPSGPARKIMRRGAGGVDSPRHGENMVLNARSRSGTNHGGSGSDEEQNGTKDKSLLTREEREHRYIETRARIFSDFDEKPAEPAEGAQGSSDKGISRSSSASGLRKGKKNRKPKDDSFEARSAYTQYVGQPFYQSQTQGPQESVFYPGMNSLTPYQSVQNATPFIPSPQTMPMQVPQMSQQDYAGSMSWTGSHLNQTYPMPQNMTSQGPVAQPGFDASGGFQYPSPQMTNQSTPKPHQLAPAGYYQSFQPQNDGLGWQQNGYQNCYTQPQAFPVDNTFQSPYASQGYAQPDLNPINGQNMGGYSAQSFNPRSQAFVPRGGGMQFPTNGAWSPLSAYLPQQTPGSAYNANYPSPQHPSSAQSRRPSSNRSQSNHQGQGPSTLPKWPNTSTLPPKPPPTASTLSFQVPQYSSGPQPLPNNPFSNQGGRS